MNTYYSNNSADEEMIKCRKDNNKEDSQRFCSSKNDPWKKNETEKRRMKENEQQHMNTSNSSLLASKRLLNNSTDKAIDTRIKRSSPTTIRVCKRSRTRRYYVTRAALSYLYLSLLFTINFHISTNNFFAMANSDDDSSSGTSTGSGSTGTLSDDYYYSDTGSISTSYVTEDDIAQDDDEFKAEGYVDQYGFEGVSIMPVSCIQYNNGHMIKFELFEGQNNYQCHFKNLGTFVVSISHFMRAYFNQQALLNGNDFKLPGDAGYLNCVLLQQTAYSNVKLYAKIGCMDRETYTSTKLQLHVFSDNKCSVPYDDGRGDRYHASKGYEINGYTFNTKVSFRPSFYSCQTCKPEQISDSFQKRNYWYDDDYIGKNGYPRDYGDDGTDSSGTFDDDSSTSSSITASTSGSGSTASTSSTSSSTSSTTSTSNSATNIANYYQSNDDDFYKYQDDDNRRTRNLLENYETTHNKYLQQYQESFWKEVTDIRRSLEANGGDDDSQSIGDWNFCERVHRYGAWCDENCRAIDTFRVDEWSKSDIFLLMIMVVFMSAMMLLVFIKRMRAYEKAKIFAGSDGLGLDSITNSSSNLGIKPSTLGLVFTLILVTILSLARMKFVNETLVFAVVICILLFIYMLKLTLFERQPKSVGLLPAAYDSKSRHMFDS